MKRKEKKENKQKIQSVYHVIVTCEINRVHSKIKIDITKRLSTDKLIFDGTISKQKKKEKILLINKLRRISLFSLYLYLVI